MSGRLKSSELLKGRNEVEGKQSRELVNERSKDGGKKAGSKLATE